MTLHQLRIFSAAAKHLSVTKAGWEVHISQPSTSQQLKLLEEECGVRLYKKNGQGIELTREGRLFFKEAEPILLQMEKLKRIFSLKTLEDEVRLLTVGGSHAPSASFLPRLASIFRETHSHTRLVLRTDNSLFMEQLVRNSDVEIAVVTSHSGASPLVYERCRQEELVIFASSKHPAAKRQQLTVAELACIPLVVFKRGKVGGTANILNQIEERGFRPNIVMHCETAEAAKVAVKRRMGLGILYKDLVQADIQRGDLKIVHVPGLEMHVDSFIVYPKQKPLSRDARDFLALLREGPKGTKKSKGSLRPAA